MWRDVIVLALREIRRNALRSFLTVLGIVIGVAVFAIALLARQARDGKALPKGWWDPGAALVTAKNVDAILARQRTASTRTAFYRARVDEQLANPSAHLRPLPGG